MRHWIHEAEASERTPEFGISRACVLLECNAKLCIDLDNAMIAKNSRAGALSIERRGQPCTASTPTFCGELNAREYMNGIVGVPDKNHTVAYLYD